MIPDIPTMEKLNMEKECIGIYVSGHPLDDYQKAIDHAVTLKSSNMARVAAEEKAAKDAMAASGAKFYQLRDAGKSYVALGMLSGRREITTKKGDRMAFCKLLDKVLLNQVLKSEHYGTILCLVEVFVATRRPV